MDDTVSERSAITGFEPENWILCGHCMCDNHPLADFCEDCSRPIGRYTTLDPFKNIFARGWVYRRAAAGHDSLAVLIGMWLLFLPMVLASLMVLGIVVSNGMFGGFIEILIFVSFNLCFVVAPAVLLKNVTTGYIRERKRAQDETASEDE
jgi:hypothetical protein